MKKLFLLIIILFIFGCGSIYDQELSIVNCGDIYAIKWGDVILDDTTYGSYEAACRKIKSLQNFINKKRALENCNWKEVTE